MFIKLYLIALLIFFALDILWLGVFAKKFYTKQLGPLMKAKVGWPAAVLFYLLYVGGLVTLVFFPALTDHRLYWEALALALSNKPKLILDPDRARRRHLILPDFPLGQDGAMLKAAVAPPPAGEASRP